MSKIDLNALAAMPHGRAAAPTPKQSAARTRNWRVFQLRGLYTRMFWLTGERLEQAKALVEAELRAMGAQTMAEQRAALAAKWEAMDK